MEKIIWEKPAMNEVAFAADEYVSACYTYSTTSNTSFNMPEGNIYYYIGPDGKMGHHNETHATDAAGQQYRKRPDLTDTSKWIHASDLAGNAVDLNSNNMLEGDSLYNSGTYFEQLLVWNDDCWDIENNVEINGDPLNGDKEGNLFVSANGKFFYGIYGTFTHTPTLNGQRVAS